MKKIHSPAWLETRLNPWMPASPSISGGEAGFPAFDAGCLGGPRPVTCPSAKHRPPHSVKQEASVAAPAVAAAPGQGAERPLASVVVEEAVPISNVT